LILTEQVIFDFTKISQVEADGGLPLLDGNGNPHGGLVFSNVWTGGTGLGQVGPEFLATSDVQ